jgi:hypothetical protein
MAHFLSVTQVGMGGNKRIYVNVDLIRSVRPKDGKSITLHFGENDSMVVEGDMESIINAK